MKMQYQGELLFTKDDTPYKSCTFEGECLWKLTFDELVISEKLGGGDSSQVPKFVGHLCNAPDNIGLTCP